MMIDRAKYFLQPRICPEIRLSKNDLIWAVKEFGTQPVAEALHSLITTNYDFPLSKYTSSSSMPSVHDVARFSCPEMKKSTSTQQVIVTSPMESTISSLRVSRKSVSDPPYPGITVQLMDKYAYDDKVVAEIVEPHMLKVWYGNSKTYTTCPQEKYYDKSIYEKMLSKLLTTNNAEEENFIVLDSNALRSNILLSSEISLPHVELYNYILNKLEPKSINVFETGFGSSIMSLLRYSTIHNFKCSYRTSLGDEVLESLKAMIKTYNKHGKSSFTSTSSSVNHQSDDLVIGEVFPFETYHMRNLITNSIEDYQQYMNQNVFMNIEKHTENLKEGVRFVIVIPLRESKKHPTIEPLILFILSRLPNLMFAGNLISHKKEFIVLLFIVKKKVVDEEGKWNSLFNKLYPELLTGGEPNVAVEDDVSPPQPMMTKSYPVLPRNIETDGILFPSKVRQCTFSSTHKENGETLYQFSTQCQDVDIVSRFEQSQQKPVSTDTVRATPVEEVSEPCGTTDDVITSGTAIIVSYNEEGKREVRTSVRDDETDSSSSSEEEEVLQAADTSLLDKIFCHDSTARRIRYHHYQEEEDDDDEETD